MKRSILKNLKPFLLLIGLLFTLNGCLKDDFSEDVESTEVITKNNPKYIIKTLHREEIRRNQNLVNKLKQNIFISPFGENTAGRNTNTDSLNITIDESYAIYIETADGSYHSYTFKAIDNAQPELMKNFILSLKEDGSYKEILTSYYLTEQDLEYYRQTGSLDFDTSIIYSNSTAFSANIDVYSRELMPDLNSSCYDYDLGTSCSGSQHHTWEERFQCPIFLGTVTGTPPSQPILNLDLNCADNGGSDSGDTGDGTDDGVPDGDGNNNGGGGDGNPEGNEDPVITIPIFEDPTVDEQNCAALYNFTTSSYSQDEFNFLEGQVDAGIEKGFVVKADPEFPGFSTDPIQSTNDCEEIPLPFNTIIYAVMHVHPTGCGNGTQPMFYTGDLNTLYKLASRYNPNIVPSVGDSNALFTVYMTVENYVYALKIEDLDKLSKIGDIFSNPDDKKDFNDKLLIDFKNSDDSTLTPSQDHLAAALLKFLEDQDLGISVYRSLQDDIYYNPNKPPDAQPSNWKKLNLKPNNDLDDSQGCN